MKKRTTLNCPGCDRLTDHSYAVQSRNKHFYFYKCKRCLCHFRAVSVALDLPLTIIDHSPLPRRENNPAKLYKRPCPYCGAYGKVKITEKRADGKWRTHKCTNNDCQQYFYTCEDAEGVATHKLKRTLYAIDI